MCTHSSSGAVHPRVSCVHIKQCTPACITTITCLLAVLVLDTFLLSTYGFVIKAWLLMAGA